MNARQVMRVIYALAAGAMPVVLWASSSGPDPRYTAAPGDSRLACASAGCHTSSINGGPINVAGNGGSVTISFSPTRYTPGTPVSVTVRVSDPVNKRYGFQATARLETNLATAQAGRFVPVAGQSAVLCENGAPRSTNGNCSSSAPVEFVEHTTPSTTGIWTFNWTPPATASGPIHFYAAGNAVNGNGTSDGGDRVYTTEAVLAPAVACVSQTPAITNIISAGAFGARADFSPGSWLEVYGSNFSTVTREWGGADFNGSTAPKSLDQVKVTINGQEGFVSYISPGQINVQAPENAGAGPMAITVTNCDKTSAPVTLQQLRSAPGLLAPPSAAFLVNGKQFLAAINPDGSYVGNIAGVASHPAIPGQTITTYGVGFGATTPGVVPGQITGGATDLANPLVMTVGGVQVTQIPYKGLVAPFVGLYQFNFVVPNVPDGDQPMTVQLGGVALPQTLFLSVKR